MHISLFHIFLCLENLNRSFCSLGREILIEDGEIIQQMQTNYQVESNLVESMQNAYSENTSDTADAIVDFMGILFRHVIQFLEKILLLLS